MINNRINLNDLAIFALVVKNKSFTKASREANVSKAWVSKKISLMEKNLGVKLLNRTTRSLSLTLGGEMLFRHCQAMLQQVNLAESELRGYLKDPAGKLLITCPEISGMQLLPSIVDEFQRLYPKVNVHLIISDKLIDLTQYGIDFAFRTGKLSDSRLISRYIGKVPRCLVASPNYLSNHPLINSPQDLKGHQLLKHSSLASWPLTNREEIFHCTVKNPVIESNSLIFLHNMACLDHGITFLPYYLCAESIEKKRLVKVLPQWLNCDNEYYLIFHKEKSLLYSHQLFKEFILSSDLSNKLLGDYKGINTR